MSESIAVGDIVCLVDHEPYDISDSGLVIGEQFDHDEDEMIYQVRWMYPCLLGTPLWYSKRHLVSLFAL